MLCDYSVTAEAEIYPLVCIIILEVCVLMNMGNIPGVNDWSIKWAICGEKKMIII
jgi:hypothetical protein